MNWGIHPFFWSASSTLSVSLVLDRDAASLSTRQSPFNPLRFSFSSFSLFFFLALGRSLSLALCDSPLVSTSFLNASPYRRSLSAPLRGLSPALFSSTSRWHIVCFFTLSPVILSQYIHSFSTCSSFYRLLFSPLPILRYPRQPLHLLFGCCAPSLSLSFLHSNLHLPIYLSVYISFPRSSCCLPRYERVRERKRLCLRVYLSLLSFLHSRFRSLLRVFTSHRLFHSRIFHLDAAERIRQWRIFRLFFSVFSSFSYSLALLSSLLDTRDSRWPAVNILL